MTTQQEELRQINDELQERTRALELQRESLLSTETVLRQKAVKSSERVATNPNSWRTCRTSCERRSTAR